VIGILMALGLHGGIGVAFSFLPGQPGHKQRVVEVEIRKPPPPPPTPPEPPPERMLVQKSERPREAPRPTQVAKKPPDKPPPPVFGLDQKDTVASSSFSVPLGNTTMADPQTRGKAEPLPATSAPGGRFLGEDELARQPEHDDVACGRTMDAAYTASPAYAEGVEGKAVFRIEVDAEGKVRRVTPVKRLGHGLDELAMGFLKFNPKCRFKPAIGKDGKPGAFVIDRYEVNFELTK
jgi:hypothetical protein